MQSLTEFVCVHPRLGTPHNGRKEFFAEPVRLLEPTAVDPTGELITDEVKWVVVRRHRHSPEVAQAVGSNWAEGREPLHLLVQPSPAEDAAARELDQVWLHPSHGTAATRRQRRRPVPWTLAKRFYPRRPHWPRGSPSGWAGDTAPLALASRTAPPHPVTLEQRPWSGWPNSTRHASRHLAASTAGCSSTSATSASHAIGLDAAQG